MTSATTARTATTAPPMVLLLALAAGCSDAGEPPTWGSLLDGPRSAVDGAPAPETPGVRSVDGDLVADVPDEVWQERFRGLSLSGFWAAESPFVGTPISDGGGALYSLSVGGRDYRFVAGSGRNLAEMEPGSFSIRESRVVVRSLEGGPPFGAQLVFHLSRAAAGGDRFVGRRLACDALVLRPGQRVGLPFRAPPGSVLRFGTVFEPGLHPGLVQGASVRFRVTLDGEELDLSETPYGLEPVLAWRTVELPLAEGELVFSVEGPFAHTAIATPTLGPADTSTSPRPDLVLFLADTFRADNLSAYGAELGLTPNLDAFARRGRTFTNAYSTATFTLPAHASLFTALFPYQAGILGDGTALSRDLGTIAEALRDGGYRTAAVTDGLFVSRLYGMDQGFEVFDELHDDLDSTMERVRGVLESADGRPLFLFVQTYRTHMPYRVSDEARADLEGRLAPTREPLNALTRTFNELQARGELDDAQRALRDRTAEELRQSYLATVYELDRWWTDFEAALAEHGRAGRTHVLLTSDHGEAFAEHDDLFHGGPAFDEVLRVPMVLVGPGVEPGTVDTPVSVLDVPRTLARLAGVAPLPSFGGRSLLDEGPDRALFGFQCNPRVESRLAVLEPGRKVFVAESRERAAEGGVLAAYDLRRDPGEQEDLSAGPATWPRELLERHRALLVELLVPKGEVEVPVRDAEHLRALEAMGYVGDD